MSRTAIGVALVLAAASLAACGSGSATRTVTVVAAPSPSPSDDEPPLFAAHRETVEAWNRGLVVAKNRCEPMSDRSRRADCYSALDLDHGVELSVLLDQAIDAEARKACRRALRLSRAAAEEAYISISTLPSIGEELSADRDWLASDRRTGERALQTYLRSWAESVDACSSK